MGIYLLSLFQKGLPIQIFLASKSFALYITKLLFLNLALLVSQHLFQNPFAIEDLGKEAEVENIKKSLPDRKKKSNLYWPCAIQEDIQREREELIHTGLYILLIRTEP